MTTAILLDRSIKPQELLTMRQASALAGVEVQTLRLWDRAGKLQCVRTEGNHRRVLKPSLYKCLGIEPDANSRSKAIGYCRVSTLSQSKDTKKGEAYNGESDLDRQRQRVEAFIQEKFPDNDYEILTDVGSGLSENRKNYLRLIELICQRSIESIIVNSKDRLSRFGQESFSKLAEINGVEIIIIDREDADMSHTEEMAADVMAIMHIYSCRYYGKRAGARRTIGIDEELIKRIHQLRSQDISYQRIEEMLEEEGFTNKHGEPFKATNIRAKYLNWLDVQKKTAVLTGKEPEPQKQAIDEWIEECCELNPNEKTESRVLYNSYSDFMLERGVEVASIRKFSSAMIKRGFSRCGLGRNRNYAKALHGVVLKG